MTTAALSVSQIESIVASMQSRGVENDSEAAMLVALWHHPERTAAVNTLVADALDTGRIMPLLTDGPNWSSADVDMIYSYMSNIMSVEDFEEWMHPLPYGWSETSVAFKSAVLDLLTRLGNPPTHSNTYRRQTAVKSIALRAELTSTPGFLDTEVLQRLQSSPDARSQTWAAVESIAA